MTHTSSDRPDDATEQAHPAVPAAEELESLALELAAGAAAVVRDGLGRTPEVTSKSTATDLVTEVDRATERWLVGRIGERRPADAVLGEEGGERDRGSAQVNGVRWVLDPIDGTVNFVLGIPQYAVSVAVEVDGRVVAGAVCNPVSGETFHARVGGGAFLLAAGREPRRLGGPREVPLARAVIGTGFSYDAARRARQVAVVVPLLPRIADVRRLGASSLDLCFVAAGRLDGYFESGLNLWDHAAGGLVAAEAGCVVSGLRGRAPSREFLAAAGAGLAPELFAALEDLDADTVW